MVESILPMYLTIFSSRMGSPLLGDLGVLRCSTVDCLFCLFNCLTVSSGETGSQNWFLRRFERMVVSP
jgi:hypothetical protein